jgi:hypothetical protein
MLSIIMPITLFITISIMFHVLEEEDAPAGWGVDGVKALQGWAAGGARSPCDHFFIIILIVLCIYISIMLFILDCYGWGLCFGEPRL